MYLNQILSMPIALLDLESFESGPSLSFFTEANSVHVSKTRGKLEKTGVSKRWLSLSSKTQK